MATKTQTKKKNVIKSKNSFVIDRSKWRCGGSHTLGRARGNGETSLLNAEGFMCCLGQVSLQCGVKKNDLKEQAEPSDVNCLIPGLTRKRLSYNDDDNKYFYLNTRLSSQAMEINDSEEYSDEERERELKSLFSKFKKKLTFKGKYAKA